MVMINGVRFMSIQDLRDPFEDVPWGALAEEIESRGVYKLISNAEEVQHFGPYTKEAQEALNAVALDMAISRRPYDPDFDLWYGDQDLTYRYGWPQDRLPSFKPHEDYPWMEALLRTEGRARVFASSLCTVGRLLLTLKANAGQLATVLENSGVHGFDAYNRPVHFLPESRDVKAVLSALTKYALASRSDPIGAVDVIGREDALVDYGWPPEQIPSFATIVHESKPLSSLSLALTNQPQLPVAAIASTKADNADKALIAALANLLVEPHTPGEPPIFNSRQALIDHLDAEYGRLNIGLSKSTLIRKIPQAISHLSDAIQERTPRATGRTAR